MCNFALIAGELVSQMFGVGVCLLSLWTHILRVLSYTKSHNCILLRGKQFPNTLCMGLWVIEGEHIFFC